MFLIIVCRNTIVPVLGCFVVKRFVGTAFLRRKYENKMVNAYNPTILSMHIANMDIQNIPDPYASCSYFNNY